MLVKILVDLSAWFVLSLIVGLLVGRAISPFRHAPVPGIDPLPETRWESAALRESEENEALVLANVEMIGH